MKTARFTAVVAAAGRPEIHPLWLAPDLDPAVKRAVRDCRVMTIHQALRGAKADYGTVGLHLEGSTQVLVFPKPLRRFSDRHIVGIDYQLIQQSKPTDPVAREALRPLKKPKPVVTSLQPKAKSQHTPSKPAPKPRAEAATRRELLAEIHQAMRELKAGRAVAAYERLSALK